MKPFTVTLGKLHVFTAGEGQGVPIVAEAHAPELQQLHDSIDKTLGIRSDDWEYRPHVTLAYVKPEFAQKYEGSDMAVGVSFQISSVTLSRADGSREVVTFGAKTAAKFVKDPALGQSDEVLVAVDPAKLDQVWKKDTNFYIGPGGVGASISDRYERFQNWLYENPNTPIEAPTVSWNTGTDAPGFSNGRHRFSVLRDMGAKRVYIAVPKNQVAIFKKFAASPVRRLYHGTLADNAWSVLKHGLQAGELGHVSATSDLMFALDWAENRDPGEDVAVVWIKSSPKWKKDAPADEYSREGPVPPEEIEKVEIYRDGKVLKTLSKKAARDRDAEMSAYSLEQKKAVADYLVGKPPLASYSDGTFTEVIMPWKDNIAPDPWVKEMVKGIKITIKNGDSVPVPHGKWMDFPEPSWGITDEAYYKLPEAQRAQMEVKEQIQRWSKFTYEKTRKASALGVTCRTEIMDAHRGELFGKAEARTEDGKLIGFVQFSEAPNFEGIEEGETVPHEIWIKYVEVVPEWRRKGVATAMYQQIQKDYPGEKLVSSGTTDEGGAFRKSLTERGILAKKAVKKIVDEWEYPNPDFDSINKNNDGTVDLIPIADDGWLVPNGVFEPAYGGAHAHTANAMGYKGYQDAWDAGLIRVYAGYHYGKGSVQFDGTKPFAETQKLLTQVMKQRVPPGTLATADMGSGMTYKKFIWNPDTKSWDQYSKRPAGFEQLGSHKTPPLSDTVYPNPEMDEGTNAYDDIHERVEGVYEDFPLKELAPQMMFKEAGAAVSPDQEDKLEKFYEAKYPLAGERVDERLVRDDVPNMSSIAATFFHYLILDGIREIPFDEFDMPPDITPQTKNLAEQIKNSGELNPLIVGVDKDGPYIVEGSHRYDALKILGAKSIPAVVVLDLEENYTKTAAVNDKADEMMAAVNAGSQPYQAGEGYSHGTHRIWNGQVQFALSTYGTSAHGLIPAKMLGVYLTDVKSLKVGQGHGTQFFHWLFNLADQYQVAIHGYAQAMGSEGLDEENLHAWYERLGFKFLDAGRMVREPRGTKTAAAYQSKSALLDIGDGYWLSYAPHPAEKSEPRAPIGDFRLNTGNSNTWQVLHDADKLFQVGEIAIDFYEDISYPSINSIRLNDKHQGRGMGRRIVQALAKFYGGLTSDPQRNTNNKAVRMWKGIPGVEEVPSPNSSTGSTFFVLKAAASKRAWNVGKHGDTRTYIWIYTNGKLYLSDKTKWHVQLVTDMNMKGKRYNSRDAVRGVVIAHPGKKIAYVLAYEGNTHSSAEFIPNEIWKAIQTKFPGYTLEDKSQHIFNLAMNVEGPKALEPVYAKKFKGPYPEKITPEYLTQIGEQARDASGMHDRDAKSGDCEVVSDWIAGKLIGLGAYVVNGLYRGDHYLPHAWVVVQGFYVDASHDQFLEWYDDEEYVPIRIGKVADPDYKKDYRIGGADPRYASRPPRKDGFLGPNVFLWAFTPQGDFKTREVDTDHSHWFEEMGLPVGGRAFDAIPRGTGIRGPDVIKVWPNPNCVVGDNREPLINAIIRQYPGHEVILGGDKVAKGKTVGQAYLLHFDIPVGEVIPPTREDATKPFHARHYLGWAENAESRIEQHREGYGARITQVIKEKGITFQVARVWDGVTREFERALKNQGGLSRHCPVCRSLGVDRDTLRKNKPIVPAAPATPESGPDFVEKSAGWRDTHSEKWVYHPNYGAFSMPGRTGMHPLLVEKTMGKGMSFGRRFDEVERGYATIDPEEKTITLSETPEKDFIPNDVVDLFQKKFPDFAILIPQEKAMAVHASAKWFYHVSFSGNVDGILSEGLQPSAAPGISGGGEKGKVFATDARGVGMWLARAEQWAYHRSDNLEEDQMIPVVLRFPKADAINPEEDPFEGISGAYKMDSVPAGNLQVWDGKKWSAFGLDATVPVVDNEGYLLGQKPKLAAGSLLQTLEGLKGELSSDAQLAYDAWTDRNTGRGLCDELAEGMEYTINSVLGHPDPYKIEDESKGRASAINDDKSTHFWVYVEKGDERYGVDIPYGIYEAQKSPKFFTKVPGVKFTPDDIHIFPVKSSDDTPWDAIKDYKTAKKPIADPEILIRDEAHRALINTVWTPAEMVDPGINKLFHGTSSIFVGAIRANGLRAGSYVTNDWHTAADEAFNTVHEDVTGAKGVGGTPTVLHLNPDAVSTTFSPDPEYTQAGDTREDVSSWKALGPVPAAAIVKVEEWQRPGLSKNPTRWKVIPPSSFTTVSSQTKTAFKIEVPKSVRTHFWEEPPEGNWEFWAFRGRPSALPGEKIVFTFDHAPIADAVVHHVEEPGKTKCENTGKYENHYKVFWLPDTFRRLDGK